MPACSESVRIFWETGWEIPLSPCRLEPTDFQSGAASEKRLSRLAKSAYWITRDARAIACFLGHRLPLQIRKSKEERSELQFNLQKSSLFWLLTLGMQAEQKHSSTHVPSARMQREVWFFFLCVSLSLLLSWAENTHPQRQRAPMYPKGRRKYTR